MDEEAEANSSRRRFLGAMTFSIGGLISAGFIVPAIAYIVGPALKRSGPTEWITLGSTAKIQPGTPTLFKAKVKRQSGWIVNEEEISAYILTDNGRDFVAMSNICTHLGCHIRWIAEKEQFFCPCHNGVFDKEGKVVAGPPPRPLDRYEVKVENGNLLILGG
jgi:quinol---cytochrome c reductase iron-sulfur subunit, bacillus type